MNNDYDKSDKWRYTNGSCSICGEPAVKNQALCETCLVDCVSDNIAFCNICKERVFAGHIIDDDNVVCEDCIKEYLMYGLS